MTRRAHSFLFGVLGLAVSATAQTETCCPELAELLPTSPARDDEFGVSVAVSGNTMVVGADRDDTMGDNAGAVYVFTCGSSGYTLSTKLFASSPAPNDQFGYSVSIDGDTLVVGSNGTNFAWVFERSGTTWGSSPVAVLSSPTPGNVGFGVIVGVSGDAIVAGAPGVDGVGLDSGSAFVFVKPAGGWVTTSMPDAELTASDAMNGNQLGLEVAIDGDTVVAGSFRSDHSSKTAPGAAYVFFQPATGWANANEDAKLIASDAEDGDELGVDVAVSGDFVIVGAWRDDDLGADAGSAYVFERDATWCKQAVVTEKWKLLASNGAAADFFGRAVSIEDRVAIVGARLKDFSGFDEGSAYQFRLDPALQSWSEVCQYSRRDPKPGDRFGADVDVRDGLVAVGAVKAETAAGPESGSAFVFDANANPAACVPCWSEADKLGATMPGECFQFGGRVAVSGNTLVVSSTGEDAGAVIDAGSLQVFERNPDGWTQVARLTASSPVDQDSLGIGLAISETEDVIVAGAWREGNGGHAGVAYVFERVGPSWVNATENATLSLDAGNPNHAFGSSVAISRSGEVIVVGDRQIPGFGAAYVFERDGLSWQTTNTPNATLTAGASTQKISSQFGFTVGIARDTIFVGAPVADNGVEINAGLVYVFEKPSGGGWVDATEDAILSASDAEDDDDFGIRLAVFGDEVVVGARKDDHGAPVQVDAGSAYVFEKPSGKWSDATEDAKLTASDASSGDEFGVFVTIGTNTIVVGARGADVGGMNNAGAAYVYVRPSACWKTTNQETDRLVALDGEADDNLGGDVGVWEDSIFVGAPGEDPTVPPIPGAGSVYVFSLLDDPVVYCTAKVNSCGGLPMIGATGVPSASATSGFTIAGSNARSNRFGLLIYTSAGRGNDPFSGGTLCIGAPPVNRSIAVSSGGTSGPNCDGVFLLDMNCFASGNCDGNPKGYLSVPGTQVNCQWWGRDTISNGAYLSDGLEYCVGL